MHLVPTQAELVGDRLLAGTFIHSTAMASKSCEPAIGLGPRQFHRASAMLTTVRARRLGVQNGLKLARVQMPPLALGLMISFLFDVDVERRPGGPPYSITSRRSLGSSFWPVWTSF